MEARLPSANPTDATPAGSPMQRLLALPQRSKIGLALGTLLLTALIAWGVSAGRQPEWRVLYASLNDKDGGAVIAALAQMNVPHKFAEGGAAILVPADKVHDARLKLASQGLPKGGTVGFELMENQKFGTTQFQERLNFQRGLEGELARSIMALSAVQSARVHLALPNQTAFLREQQKPSASVLLTLYGGRALERSQIAGIVHLVASSVPDMQTRAVSVVDQNGTLLSQAAGENVAGLDASQLQYVRQAEQSLAQRILTILEPIVGPGNVRAQVTADIDFSQSESTAEMYTPNQGSAPAAVRSQHLSEAPGGAAGSGGGSPGALSNQPPATPTSPVNGAPGAITPPTAGGPGAAAGVKRDAVTNYEVDKTVKVVRNATGNVRRLSAAVIVNHVALVGPDGKPRPVAALPAAQMEQVNALVREAIGFSKDRGDSVQVVNTPFSLPAAAPVAELPLWRQPEVLDIARSLGPWIALPLLALIVILGFVRPAMRAVRTPPPPRLAATVRDAIDLGPPSAGGATPKVTVEPDADGPALLPTAQAAKQQARSSQLEGIRQLAKQDPATVANVVRNWANQPS
ncbi:MAG TPA: flagellar basal-body MS-ring/collar protein FliF [Ramlibacter sp.]|jgi:flagellar M-ring protein FliF|uniref:flagellar basal-body MS-ring/collar protein FliF n=1 Tax=Ramlibacter sp. TaxID=1917967 RepID=UPI002D30516E|nr:flagellar basal-body MS-ring/collar protein FliF [Ramlibacter sp.]HZY19155.1 flagellar basal-body MS-ring/collar protein FliF [Ramlibacter sp.]